MNCPVCRVPLIVVERQGIELDYCVECKGLWFDADELELVTEALGLETELPDIMWLPKAEGAERPRACARCRKRMHKVFLGERPRVCIDRCQMGHGLWFDSGELGQVVSQYASAGKDGETKAEGAKAGEQRVISFLGEVLSGPKNGGAERGQEGGG